MADNVQFTINVPNPDAVQCQVAGETYQLKAGANEFDVAEYTGITIMGIPPYRLSGVTDQNGTTPSGYYDGTWYFYPSVSNGDQDKVFTLSVVNVDDMRTAQFTINVDDPSLVRAVLGGYNTDLVLKEGENTFKYDPAYETYVTISPANYGSILYSVSVDGVEVAAEYKNYNITLKENCRIDVVANVPEGDCILNFSYSEGGEGALSVSVDYEQITDFDGKSLSVKRGANVQISGNSDYKIEEVLINGVKLDYWYGSYSFNPVKDTDIYVNAHPYGNIKAKVVIDNPENIIFYKGSSYNGEIYTLTAGENEIELPENNTQVSWKATPTGIIKSVSLNGNVLESYKDNEYLADGDILTFETSELNFDQTAIVWMDNRSSEKIATYFSFQSQQTRNDISLETGYNEVAFYTEMNPFATSWYGNVENYMDVKIYLNGELLSPLYEGSTSYGFDLANNDVLKFFCDADPVDCNVTFDIAEGVECSVVKDIVTAVAAPADGFACFAGTQVDITGTALKVTVNGEAVSAAAAQDGEAAASEQTFTFTVKADTAVKIEKDGGSAVETIMGASDDDVYNTMGVKVGKKSQLDGMGHGIYIVNGKKIRK